MATAYAKQVNVAPSYAPFIVYPQSQDDGQMFFHVRGPGACEIYPWPTREAAEAEALRLKQPAPTLVCLELRDDSGRVLDVTNCVPERKGYWIQKMRDDAKTDGMYFGEGYIVERDGDTGAVLNKHDLEF